MAPEPTPSEQWNVTGKAEKNEYQDNQGPILPNNQGPVNITYEGAPPAQPVSVPTNIPLKGSQYFVGREADLQRLHEQLQQPQPVAITAVVGMGGIGKTELALQYARAYEASYPGGVCWLEARDQDISTQILTFAATKLDFSPADDLPLAARIIQCWDHWPDFKAEDSPDPALIVVDDVTDYEAIAPYLPAAPRFTRLLTTRQQHLATTVTSLRIDVLDKAAALDLLRQLAGTARIEAELETAQALCQWLGYLPLGLELVGRYLGRKPDLSLAELQQRLSDQNLAARALAQAEPGMTNAVGVASAFELSWQALSSDAQNLACLLSCFALAPIPWARVEACWPDMDAETLEDWRDEELRQLHLLQRVGAGRYQLHPLIQRFIRTKFTADSSLITAYCQAMVTAAKAMEQTPTQAQCLAWQEVLPHVQETIHQWLDRVQDEDVLWPFVALGRYYRGQGLYGQAEPWYEQAVEATRQRFGERHPTFAIRLNNLANIYQAQGRYSDAEPLYLQALEIGKQTLGEDNPNFATNLNNLALLYQDQGRYSDAEPLYLQALEITKRTLGENHPDFAISLNNLANLYKDQGRYSEAEPLALQALEITKRTLGEDHPDVAISLNNLANLYQDQGRYSEAEPLALKALEITKRTLGEDHPEVATSLNNLATLYQAQERYSEAEPLALKALEIGKRTLGEDHPEVATWLNNLATLRYQQQQYAAAQPLLLEALQIFQSRLGSDHPHTQTVQSWLDATQAQLDATDETSD